MKPIERKSTFWSRLLGLLIAFAIAAVLVFGGVKNLTSELSAAHEALAASHYELGRSQQALTAAHNALDGANDLIDDMGQALGQTQHQLAVARNRAVVLDRAHDELKHRWAASMRALAQRNDQLVATDRALRATQAELQRLRNQPQWSIIVTSERQMQQRYRERSAMSKARMFIEGDGGMLYYEGMAAEHEVEQYAAYAERTQVILTTTAPGQDVLRCLQNASLGCGAVVAAQTQAVQMQAWSYESQSMSQEMLVVDGRRGRRPGRRR